MRMEVRVLGTLAVGSWLIAVAATIDWISGNPTAPTGIVTFAVTGALFTWAALYLRKATPNTAEAAVRRVRELHRQASHGETCVYCAPLQRIGYDTTWPCDTIRALDGDTISKENSA